MGTAVIAEIEKTLAYRFKSKSLLEEALRHSSFVNEHIDCQLRDNERLEFLGDAVLNLIIGHLLMRHYPEMKEGDLSRTRAHLVNETQLAEIARDIDLGAYLLLGKGEIQTRGREKASILADAFEALVAAVYLDGGFEAARKLIENKFLPLLDENHRIIDLLDDKSHLQELVQEKQGIMPQYEVIHEEGPDHNKTFWVRLSVLGIETHGVGKSKKIAEQDAARKAMQILETTIANG
jgi:ribonuclease III